MSHVADSFCHVVDELVMAQMNESCHRLILSCCRRMSHGVDESVMSQMN